MKKNNQSTESIDGNGSPIRPVPPLPNALNILDLSPCGGSTVICIMKKNNQSTESIDGDGSPIRPVPPLQNALNMLDLWRLMRVLMGTGLL